MISVLTIWCCPCVESSPVLLEEGVCYDQCILLAKLYQSFPCFFPYSKAKFACYSRCFLTSYFCITVPYKRHLFGGCYFQKALQVFTEPFNFSFFSISGWGIDFVYCNIEWFALETNRDQSFLRLNPSTASWTLLLTTSESYSISSKGFLPTVVEINGHLN